MKERASISHLVPAAAAAGLVLIYVAGGGREPAKPEPAVPPKTSAGSSFDERLAVLDEEKEQWRQQHMPSVMDTGDERSEKELYKRMKVLGTSPVEFVDDSNGKGGLVIGKDEGSLEAFIAAGGRYSGPLPERQEQPLPENNR